MEPNWSFRLRDKFLEQDKLRKRIMIRLCILVIVIVVGVGGLIVFVNGSGRAVQIPEAMAVDTFKVVFVNDFPRDPDQGVRGTSYVVTWKDQGLTASDSAVWIWSRGGEEVGVPPTCDLIARLTWRPYLVDGQKIVIYSQEYVQIEAADNITLIQCGN